MTNNRTINPLHTLYDTHANDAEGFAFNGAARRRAFWIRRCAASWVHRIPVQLVDGKQPPELRGVSGGWYTNGGTPIAHPSAYSRSGWSNMQYRCDTRRIVVGREWTPWS